MCALLLFASACAGGSSDDGADSADNYPNKTVKLVVPYAAGGPTDLAGRALASAFKSRLGQTVVVENIVGASGARGMKAMTQSEPDGYTIEVVASSAAVVNPLVQDVGYTHEDFEMVGGIALYPYFIVVNASSPYKSAEEFFDAAKQSPGKLKIGTPGATTQPAIELKRLAAEQHVDITPVPFNGNSELVTALLGNNIDGIFVVTSEDILSQITAGKFRAIGVGSEERVDYLPDTPTFDELGFPELSGSSYNGIAVPAGTSAEVKSVLEKALKDSLGDPQVRKTIGEKYVSSEFLTGAELTKIFQDQRELYGPIVKDM